jgi:hypothetical protein
VGLEHILARMTRLADIIEMDAKQEATRQNAKAIKALVKLAEQEIQVQETEGRDELDPELPEMAKKVQNALDCLPAEIEPEHIEALIMTIAQAYAPSIRHAIIVILNAAITLQDYVNTVDEAKNATQH